MKLFDGTWMRRKETAPASAAYICRVVVSRAAFVGRTFRVFHAGLSTYDPSEARSDCTSACGGNSLPRFWQFRAGLADLGRGGSTTIRNLKRSRKRYLAARANVGAGTRVPEELRSGHVHFGRRGQVCWGRGRCLPTTQHTQRTASIAALWDQSPLLPSNATRPPFRRPPFTASAAC